MSIPRKEMESFKSLLSARRDSLIDGQRKSTEQLLSDEEVYTDAADQASADSDRSFELRLKDRDHEILASIDDALKRLDEGTFGECARCHDEITLARLQANPFTKYCLDCKADLEQAGNRYSVRH